MTIQLLKCRLLLLVALCCGLNCAHAANGFVLRDYLNRAWNNECVTFKLDTGQAAAAAAGLKLLAPDGSAVAYQLREGTIAFNADLGPFETRTYHFETAAADHTATTLPSSLKIEKTADLIRISNGQTGIALRARLQGDDGPIGGVRLNSGQWVGGSRFVTDVRPASYSARVTADGPVYAEVTCRAEFSDGRYWNGVFRLQANAPVVWVDADFEMGSENARLDLNLSQGLDATDIEWRPAGVKSEPLGGTVTAPTVFKLQPWSLWGSPRQGKWFGLYKAQGNDLLMMAARDGDVWVDLHRPRDSTVPIERTADGIVAKMDINGGRRHWMMGALPKVAATADIGKSATTPLPQQQVIKAEFPLDRVKDYVLQWPEANEQHPRLYMTRADLPRLKASYKVDAAALAKLSRTPISIFHCDPWVIGYLATGDAALGKLLTDTALLWMQQAVDMQVKQESNPWFGRAPHGQTLILSALSLADTVLGGDDVDAVQRQRLRSQAAFLGYTVMRPDYWSPLRGFGANANMTTHVAAYQTALGCFIYSHPLARTWIDAGITELKDVELDTWMDSNGGWLEAPGYSMVSWGYIIGSFIAARNSGAYDYVTDPHCKLFLSWMAKLCTPPDSRLAGTRHMPALGNTFKMAWCGDFGLAAALWKHKDPEFAANLAWMYKQNNSYNDKVGGFVASLSGYHDWLIDLSGITPKAPHYGSELFPKTGVVLRNHFLSTRENMLTLIAGENWQHYDFDSGSVTLWGKGRIVADDFGYYGRAAVADHNMLELPLVKNDPMQVREFATTNSLDYVRASLIKIPPSDENHITPFSQLDYQYSIAGDWIRQIAFVKDANALGPNYFVINDSLRSAQPSTWRMWFTCDKVVTNAQGATVIGKEDVDTDVFFARPTPVTLRTEEKTRTTSGYNPQIKYGVVSWTQTGLIADLENGAGCAAVLYPRLKSEKPPRFTALEKGRVIKVESAAGTDYVFISNKPFTYAAGDISFSGTIGTIQLRPGKRAALSLGAAGSIAAAGHSLHSDEATAEN